MRDPHTRLPVPEPGLLGAQRSEKREQANGTLAIVGGASLLIIVAEAFIALANPVTGALLHAVILFLLMACYAVAPDRPNRSVLPVVALLPLLRILSLVVPIVATSIAAMPIFAGASAGSAPALLPLILWYPLIAIPLFIGIALAARLNGLTTDVLRLRRDQVENQLLIALHGIPLGSSAYYMLRPEPLAVGSGLPGMLVASVILLVAVAFLEEVLFRGVLQQTLYRVFDNSALILTSLLFAATYFGTHSPAFILLMAGVGLLFGVYVRLSRCLWGVTAAHALLVIGLLIAWPRLLA